MTLSSSLTYVVKTRFNTIDNTIHATEFTSDNSLKNRSEAFNFIENYIEIITNEGLIQIESDYIYSKAINRTNCEISKPNDTNCKRLKLFNQEAIHLIPNETIFPVGISVSYKYNNDNKTLGIDKDKEYEIFAYKNLSQINYSEQLNHLINEYQLLRHIGHTTLGYTQLYKSDLHNLSLNYTRFKILDTPFLWVNETRQYFVNNTSNDNCLLDCLCDRLLHHDDFNYVYFVEKNCPKEIEKNIYALLHSDGGLLFVGYHPENLTESIMSDIDLVNYYHLLDDTFSKDEYLYKNINLQIFSFNDFPVLAITVFPLNNESKIHRAYNPDKIFVLRDNQIIKMKNR